MLPLTLSITPTCLLLPRARNYKPISNGFKSHLLWVCAVRGNEVLMKGHQQITSQGTVKVSSKQAQAKSFWLLSDPCSATMEEYVAPLLKPVRRPTYQIRKQYKQKVFNKKVESYNAGDTHSPPIKTKTKCFYERPLKLWSINTPGVGAQVLSYLLDLNKGYKVLERWCELSDFPDNMDMLINSTSPTLSNIGNCIVQGRTQRYIH